MKNTAIAKSRTIDLLQMKLCEQYDIWSIVREEISEDVASDDLLWIREESR